MDSPKLKLFARIVCALSALWLIGYLNTIRYFSSSAPDLEYLSYPSIKIYRVANETTGALSWFRIDWFSIADGPTGIEYNYFYIPCWPISIAALIAFASAGSFLAFGLLCRRVPRTQNSQTL